MQDSHLALFEFVGRMLGKAVYEVAVHCADTVSSEIGFVSLIK